MAEVFQEKTDKDTYAALGGEGGNLVGEVYAKYDLWRQARRPYEVQWYLNASALRGFPDVRWNAEMNRLEARREPKHRQRKRINFIKAKYTARISKFTRIPPGPSVQPATTDREDIFNARATQKALEYITRKIDLAQKWMQAMQWVPVTGKAYWWIRYDPKSVSYTEFEGQTEPILGDVAVDFGSAFEFLPADPGIETLAGQPEIIRAKLVPLKDIQDRYGTDPLTGLPNSAIMSISPETTNADIFFYQRQIADLGSRYQGQSSRALQEQGEFTHVLRLELFTAPCAKYPQGRYVVCAGQQLLREEQGLPGNFARLTENPFPVVEFADEASPGQFWPDAFIERLITLQAEYNDYRSQIAEHMSLHMFPKAMVAKQANLHPDAYNNEAGEKIEYTALPNIDPIKFLQPESVLGDVWNLLQMIKKEMDDVSLIYPTSIGGAGGTTSGFQTNLLQEASDQVHGPTIQRNAYALREAYLKIRRLMKDNYDIPRLVSITGKNNIPEVFEFSRQSIDEQADVIIEPEQLAPQMKSARLDMFRQMFVEGMFGNPQDPKVLKRVNEMLRTGFQDFDTDMQQRDSEQAQLENIQMERAEPLQKPQPWEDHLLHWELHTDLFKSPQTKAWSPQQWNQNVWHAIVHLNYVNPSQAMMMAQEFGLSPQLAQLQFLQQPPMQPPQGAPTLATSQPLQGPPGAPPMGPPGAGMGGPPNGQTSSELPIGGPPGPDQGPVQPPMQGQQPMGGPPPF